MNKRKKILPKLRFPEFEAAGEWKIYRLRELADRITQRVEDRKLVTLSISAGTGFVSQAEKFSRDISGKQYCHYIYLQKGDFSYNKGNSKTFPQGCIYELEEYDEAAVPNAFISFRFKEKFISSFYKGYFDQNFHGQQLMKFITSGARSDGLLNISPTDFFSIVFPTPAKKAEQQKIAACLSSIEDLIHAENRKLDALKKYKQGFMQKLFPAEGKALPEWRFPAFQGCGEWNAKSIENSCKMFSGGTPDTSKKEFYGGSIPFIRSAEIGKCSTKLFITEEGFRNSSAKMVKKGDVLIALYGANSGEVALSQIDGAINQAILCLRHKTNNAFVYHYLTHIKNRIIAKYLQGGQGNLSGQIIKAIHLYFPQPEEQEKVANCLSEMDFILTQQFNKVEKLKAHKRGLLQRLFPSLEEVDV
ncbi:MAG: restriction endonuclease subunit S [Oscillibacter sp.]|nr:restriction endonuclease subunit S [Oscillibacter sp.]